MSMTRLSLLAGSSIVAAMLAASPTYAANECGNPSANGAAPDFLFCAPGTYLSGIDYSTTSDGDLTVILRDRVDTGTSNTAGTGAIRLFGKTGENMSLIREDTPSVVGDPRIINTAGRAVDVTTQGDGNALVNLTDGDPTAGEPTTPAATAPAALRLLAGTDAIRAEATGTGAVSVIIAETGTQSGTNHVRATITAGGNVGSNGSGVVARSTSGAINVDVRGATLIINATNGGGAVDAQSVSGNVNISTGTSGAAGRLFGVRAQTGGTGTVTLSVGGSISANATTGQAGIDTVAGTGTTTINLTTSTLSGGAGAAIRSVSAGLVSVQNTGSQVNGRVDFSGVTAGGVTFNNTGATTSTGRWNMAGTSTFSSANDTLTFGGVGVNTATNGSIVNFGSGNDTFNLVGKLSVVTYINLGNAAVLPSITTEGMAFNFGTGADTMNVSGVFGVDYTTITGLETLNNSGLILLGAYRVTSSYIADYLNSDGEANDVLTLSGTNYVGSGAARLAVDVLLGSGTQPGCATPTGMGDCLGLRDGSTSGSTLLTVSYAGDGATLGGYDPVGITVVDVSGAGTSAAAHFTLDPNSPGYVDDPLMGGAIDRPGLFRYTLRYDAANQRHVIVGLPRSEVLEYVVLAGAAQSIWHMTSEAVTDRQSNLRAGGEGTMWMRATGDYTQRDLQHGFDSFGQTLALDHSYTLYAGTVMGGMDLMHGQSGAYGYALGGQIGYVGSSLQLNHSTSTGRFTGATGGLYGSLWSDRFFLDGTLNGNFLTLDYSSPGLGSKTNTYLYSFGAQAEGGLRTSLSSGLFLEPLASFAFVRTTFEEISLKGGEIQPDDSESLRGAVGLRVGAQVRGASVNVNYFVTGRAWNEFAGDSGGLIRNPGAGLTFADDFSGAFGEAEAGVNFFNTAGTVSGFASTGVKFKDGYSATSLSLGARLAW